MSRNMYYLFMNLISFDPVRLSDAYMYQWIKSTLVEIMACDLNDAKLLSKPVLAYNQWDPLEQTSMKLQ